MRVEKGKEAGRIEGRELRFDGALEWLSDEAKIRLDQTPDFHSLFASRCPGSFQQKGGGGSGHGPARGACSCGCEGMTVKGDWREAEEEETREAWQKRLPPPPRGLFLMLQSVPRSRHCEPLHRQSKRSCPDSI